MNYTQLYRSDNDLRTYLLVMDQGDEAVSEITAFAKANDVNAASLTAIGACTSATLAYFDSEKGEYINRRFIEQMEIASLIGDIANDDGQPALAQRGVEDVVLYGNMLHRAVQRPIVRDLHGVVGDRHVDHGNARRIVAPVLEPFQALNKNGHNVASGCCCDDAAHASYPIKKG